MPRRIGHGIQRGTLREEYTARPINATVPAFAYANYQSKTERTIPIFELQEAAA